MPLKDVLFEVDIILLKYMPSPGTHWAVKFVSYTYLASTLNSQASTPGFEQHSFQSNADAEAR